MVSVLSMVILVSALSLLDGATKTERGLQARLDSVVSLREAMTETTRSVRQATAIIATSTTSRLEISTIVDGDVAHPHDVIYDVSAGAYRVTDNGGTPRVIASNITSATPFCYSPTTPCAAPSPSSPTSIRITLAGEPDVMPDGSITLSSDVELRNIR